MSSERAFISSLTEDVANLLVNEEEDIDVDETKLANGMDFLGHDMPLSRTELDGHLQAHKGHLIAVSERIREEMSSHAVFVYRAEMTDWERL